MAPSITILLCTFNGERFLSEQLASFEAQTVQDWLLVASDDGSTDATLDLLGRFRARHGAERVKVVSGPGRGFVANFLGLVCRDDLAPGCFAFSDQDDVWEPQKLAKALSVLSRGPTDRPAAYCSRTRLIDAQGRETGLSPAFRRRPAFENALVQSIAGGNTFVFNQPLRDLLRRVGADLDVPSHDWWLYLVATACGGDVFYDLWPSVRYRIHGANEVGSNVGFWDRAKRLRLLLQGRFLGWTEQNIAALERVRPWMTPQARDVLSEFRRGRELPLLRRLAALRRSGVYRQTTIGDLGLLFGTALNRI